MSINKLKLLVSILLRKIRSAIIRASLFFSTITCRISVLGESAISIAPGCTFGRDVLLRATDGGSISIGSGVSLADRVQIVTTGFVSIENDVFIGVGSIIVCKQNIIIGSDSLIAEYVVIRDQDHRTDSRPVNQSGFHTKAIHIGKDVWIGCKASVLRGASIGDRCVIGAHALVNSHIPEDMLAVGLPARVIKRIGNH